MLLNVGKDVAIFVVDKQHADHLAANLQRYGHQRPKAIQPTVDPVVLLNIRYGDDLPALDDSVRDPSVFVYARFWMRELVERNARRYFDGKSFFGIDRDMTPAAFTRSMAFCKTTRRIASTFGRESMLCAIDSRKSRALARWMASPACSESISRRRPSLFLNQPISSWSAQITPTFWSATLDRNEQHGTRKRLRVSTGHEGGIFRRVGEYERPAAVEDLANETLL